MSTVESVKSWMQFWGWDDGGKPGSLKRDIHGAVVARAGDADWEKDLEKAIQYSRREQGLT